MPDAPQMPEFVRRGLPGPGHAAMAPLVGGFDCRMLGYIAGGTADAPVEFALTTTREWIAADHHLRDETSGGDYYRLGILGYSNMDERFEWVTFDAVNAGFMIYQGRPGSGPAFPADLPGVFTDQGVLGDEHAGDRVDMRTVISIADDDHHTIDIYMTVPGGAELLADRKLFTRR